MSDLRIAWAAGFVDGEGSIRLTRRGSSATANLRVSQIDAMPLEDLRQLFGGSITEQSRRTTSGNVVWVWNVSGLQAINALEALLPFLRSASKRAAAVAAISGSTRRREIVA